jgi:ABC-type dipeptide/oligopeptide/nickel transport system permease subunit
MAALAVIVLVVLAAAAAPLVAAVTGHPPDAQYRETGLTPEGLPRGPTTEFWLGTDDLGRDLLVRLVYGARLSLLMAVASTAMAVTVGAAAGLCAGYVGGWVDVVIARLSDIVLAAPFVLVAIAMATLWGPSVLLSVLVIASFSWAAMARLVRGQVLELRERDFVRASRSLGASHLRIMATDILPHVVPTVVVYASLLVPVVILLQATLSYLGLGVAAPTPDWGAMVSDAQPYYATAWWYVAFPSAALVGTALALNLLGDGMRDALDLDPHPGG